MKVPSSRGETGVRRYLYLTGEVLVQSYREWRLDRTMRLGAGLAYYAVFAIIPLFVVALSLAGIFFDDMEIQSYLTTQVTEFFGQELDQLVIGLIDIINELEFEATFANLGIIGLVALIVSASFVFVAFQDALDVIWKSPVSKGVRLSAKKYLLAYSVVLLVGAVLAAAIFVSVVSDFVEKIFVIDSAVFRAIAEVIDFLGIWMFGALVLTFLLHTLVKVQVRWQDFFLGSTVTIFLMYMGFFAIGWYLSTVGNNSVTGALGGIFLVLVWVYYEAQILLAGIQFTKVISYRRGNKELKKQLVRSAV